MKSPSEKPKLHPRNKHHDSYNFQALNLTLPELTPFVFTNKFGTQTIDFANPEAVKMLNKALLAYHYEIKNWEIPSNYLCPPIPGRADYVHYLADILADENGGNIPKGKAIKCLDIGTGANCIYPIIGHQEYGWSFVGTDIDSLAVKNAEAIVSQNENLNGDIEIRLQSNSKHFFKGIIKPNEKFDLTMCNPPFHASAEEAAAQSLRKVNNLTGKQNTKAKLNFGGQNHELWYEGGELWFLISMIRESVVFADSCLWFTSLVSKKENLAIIYKELEKAKVKQTKTIEMAQGQKISRLVAWSF